MKLIDKEAVVLEIKRQLAFYLKEIENNKKDPWTTDIAKRDILQEILSFLDTLEVKEVDFEMELKEFLRQYYNYDYPKQYQDGTGSNTMPHIVETAKYFFNLGLKAQKGE